MLKLIKFEKLSESFCSEVISEDLITGNYQCMKFVFPSFSRKLKDSASECAIFYFNGKTTSKNSLLLFNSKLRNYPNFPISLEDCRVLKLNETLCCIGEIPGNIKLRRAFKFEIGNKEQ